MTDSGTLFAGFPIPIVGIIIVGIVAYALFRKQKTTHVDNSTSPTSRPSGRGAGLSQSDNSKRLFEEHLKTFEQDYLAYLLAKEARQRRLPLATREALAHQYGANKGDPPYRPNLDLPKKGVPSAEVTQLMKAWLAANDNAPTDDPPSFRVRRIIKARLDRQVAEICDKAAQTR